MVHIIGKPACLLRPSQLFDLSDFKACVGPLKMPFGSKMRTEYDVQLLTVRVNCQCDVVATTLYPRGPF